MSTAITFVVENKAVIIGALFAVSELLSLVPSVKANGIFQAVYNFLSRQRKAE